MSDSCSLEINTPSTYKGKADVLFFKADIDKVAAAYKFAIVGKFSYGRPKLEEI